MIYFSELKGTPVITEDNVRVGKIEDLIFVASDTPHITKIVVRKPTNEKLIIASSYLKKINSTIVIQKDFNTTGLIENELFIVKNILDKQIIDLQGNKVVRVNDVVIQEKSGFYIAGVDVGLLGIVRWFKIEKFFSKISAFLNLKTTSEFLSWGDIQPLELARGQVKLKKEEDRLARLRPEDLADYLERTNVVNARKVLRILEDKFAAEVITNLTIHYQTSLFKHFTPEKGAKILSTLDSDEVVDILLTLSSKRREQIIAFLNDPLQKKVRHLLSISHTPIGKLVSSEFFTARSSDSVGRIIDNIRRETTDFRLFTAVYVLNETDQLVGVFSLHELLLQKNETPAYKFMLQNLVTTHLSTPIEIAVKKMLKYKLASLPVIDSDKRLLGIVTFDDAAEILLPKLT